MTRINIIPVEELSDAHLLAEHREIKRIPNCILNGRFNLCDIPEKYTMGKGHIKFFRDKVLYLKIRYNDLHNEILRRGFNHTYKFPQVIFSFDELNSDNFLIIPKSLYNDWVPNTKDYEIIINRINEKIAMKPHWYRFNGVPLEI